MRKVSFQEMIPHFLGIGVQKAGTTTLHSLLGLHPEIFLPNKKELHFFSLNYEKGLPWYCRHFEDASSNQFVGEITPYYIFHPYVAERIVQDLGKIKVIVLLRDPVARSISHYKHSVRLGFETLAFDHAIQEEHRRLSDADESLKTTDGRHKNHQELSYVSRSLYRIQIERYWKLLGKENVLILPSETFFHDPWYILQKIYRFLELSIPPRPTEKLLRMHANQNLFFGQQELTKECLDHLRLKLDDSYCFAVNELGWGRELTWNWH